MSEFLINHATTNIWCNPLQDRQAIIQPVSMGKPLNGRYQRIRLGHVDYYTPTNDYYHVYQIGHYPLEVMGLEGVVDKWQQLSKVATNSKCHIDLYTNTGFKVPLFESYIMRLPNKMVVLAVRKQDVFDLTKETIFFRHYSNAYFESERSSQNDLYKVDGIRYNLKNESSVVRLLNEMKGYINEKHATSIMLNGEYRESLVFGDLKPNDIIEYVVDDSVDTVETFSLDGLDFVHSVKDSQRKYVIDLGVPHTIRYHDDVEFRVITTDELGRYVHGRFFHRNKPMNVRMIAEATYAIAVDQVDFLSNHIGDVNISIQVVAKKAGYKRPLVFEANRLHELRKLPAELRKDIITGKRPSIDVWEFNHLEQSAYPLIMREPVIDSLLTTHLLRCYGYNALAYYGAMNLMFPYDADGIPRVFVPESYRKGSLYEYDSDKRLVSYRTATGDYHEIVASKTATVEFVEGEAHENCQDIYNSLSVPDDPDAEFRLYHRLRGQQDWIDITASVNWTVDNGIRYHDYTSSTHEWVVRKSGWHWIRKFGYMPVRGVLEVSLFDDFDTVELPFGRITVRMNDIELVQGVDYHVYRQTIWIAAKHHLNRESEQIVVRCEGFPEEKSDGTVGWGEPDKVGWIINGLVSRDDSYDLRDDRLYRAVVNGELMKRDEIDWFEDSYDRDGWMVNGTPYSIHFLHPSLKPLGIKPQVQELLVEQAKETDKKVTAYLSQVYPAPPVERISPIPERWRLCSIFIARILDDMLGGTLYVPEGRITDGEIRVMLKHYEYLLPFDMANTRAAEGVDKGLVTVHPHMQDYLIYLPAYQYTFIDRVAKLYLDGLVDMTGQLAIKING